MRRFAITIALLSLTTPVLAHEAAPEARIAEQMNDPAMQAHVANSVSAALAALLDLRIGGMERAIDPHSSAHPDDTVRDRALEHDPDLEDRVADDAHRVTRGMGAMAGQMAILMPELREMASDMGRKLKDMRQRYPAGGDDWDD